MIEIKCPYSRKIVNDYIPPKYLMQIYGQLAVCELEECDYIECDFKTFESIEDYLTNISSDSKIKHGIIAEYMNDNKEYHYLYSNAYLTPNDAIKDIEEQISHEKSCNLLKLTPWHLNTINVQRVMFKQSEWDNIEPKISNFWNLVEEYKTHPPPPPEKESKKIKFIDDDD